MLDTYKYFCLLGKKYCKLPLADPTDSQRFLLGGNKMTSYFPMSSLFAILMSVHIRIFIIITLNE